MERDPEEIALLQHSSGTTGLQKGIALSHRSVFNQLDTYTPALKTTEDDVIVSWLPLYHDMGLDRLLPDAHPVWHQAGAHVSF